MEGFNIVHREWYNLARKIKESIYIRVNNSALNSSIGKYNLSYIWDRVLFTAQELKIMNQQELEGPQVHNTRVVPSTPTGIENISCRPYLTICKDGKSLLPKVCYSVYSEQYRTYVYFYIQQTE